MNADYVSLSTYLCFVNWSLMFSQRYAHDAWCLFKMCLWHAISCLSRLISLQTLKKELVRILVLSTLEN